MGLKSVCMTSDTKDLSYSKEDVPAIVRACRAHDALVEATETALTLIRSLYRNTKPLGVSSVGHYTETKEAIEQILAEAKEES